MINNRLYLAHELNPAYPEKYLKKENISRKIFVDSQKKRRKKKGKLRNIEKRWNEEYKTISPLLEKSTVAVK